MIVVDASTAVAALLHSGQARESVKGQRPHAPHLIDPEVASTLRRLVLVNALTARDGKRALDAWRKLRVRRHAIHPLLGRVWELRENLSAYDASYAALAEALDCPLVTADARLSRASGIACTVTVVPR
ncbi:MAG TPA: type II toxin-antitoxin system VapC family toxin [Mycobacterium sp.]|nr:type II toxin-antitoxin system VapC family toxin [Mycobacterium sp.]